MNYAQSVEYIFSMLPMFHRIGAAAYKNDLSNITRLCSLLDNPQHKFRSIHIAGTNGKGSVSHLLASILQSAGYKTGLFTSPHLRDFRERIRIDGEMIPKSTVSAFISNLQVHLKEIQPSFFEMTTALAFSHFSKKKVDIAVIETGMGGRLDSTNVILPVLSVITNIGWDHMQFLGDTLEKIASEKAGIIKPKTPVVVGQSNREINPVFAAKAQQMAAQISFADERFAVEKQLQNINSGQSLYRVSEVGSQSYRLFYCPLSGDYQQKNLATVVQAIAELRRLGFDISDIAVQEGIRDVIIKTGFMGRWHVLSQTPLTICDVAHNADGLRVVVNQLNNLQFSNLHLVLGMVADKDIPSLLEILPKNGCYYFCKPDIPRGLDQQLLADAAKATGLSGNVYNSVKEAYRVARKKATVNDLIFITGSTFVVAEIV
ncbi:MAG TPA: folylpolyglutamate synthase/dihydrofolate synthase family protein [Bacteroidales bacterium]|nr:folylpolyglutamate synthase/dihydrofolate synthase family protein [Bacteroidales bacterium]